MTHIIVKRPRQSILLTVMNRCVGFYLVILCFNGCHSVIIEESYDVGTVNICVSSEFTLPCKFTYSTSNATPPITQWRILDTNEVVGSINSSRILNPGANFVGRISLVSTDTFDSSINITLPNSTSQASVFYCEVDIAADTDSPQKKHIVRKLEGCQSMVDINNDFETIYAKGCDTLSPTIQDTLSCKFAQLVNTTEWKLVDTDEVVGFISNLEEILTPGINFVEQVSLVNADPFDSSIILTYSNSSLNQSSDFSCVVDIPTDIESLAIKYISLKVQGCQPVVDIEKKYETIYVKGCDTLSPTTQVTLPCKFATTGAPSTEWKLVDTDEVIGSISNSGILTPGNNFIGRVSLVNADPLDSSIILTYSNSSLNQSSDFSCEVDIPTDMESPAIKYISLKVQGCQSVVDIENNYETIYVKGCDTLSPTTQVTLSCKFATTGAPTTEWKLVDTDDVVGSISNSGILTPGTNFGGRVSLVNADPLDSSIILTYSNSSLNQSSDFSCVVDIPKDIESPAIKYISLKVQGCHSAVNMAKKYEEIYVKCDPLSPTTAVTLPCTYTTDGAPTTEWKLLDTDEVVGFISSSGVLTPGVNFAGRIQLTGTDPQDSSIILKYPNVTLTQSREFSCAVDIASDIESPAIKYISMKLEGCLPAVEIENNYETIYAKCDPISPTTEVTLLCKFSTDDTSTTEWRMLDTDELVCSISSSGALTPGNIFLSRVRLVSTTDLHDSSIILTYPNVTRTQVIDFSCAVDIGSNIEPPAIKYISLKLEGCLPAVEIENNYETIYAKCDPISQTTEVTLPCKFSTDGTPTTEWKMLDTDELVGSISSSGALTPGNNFLNRIRLVSTADLHDSSIILTYSNVKRAQVIDISCAVDIGSNIESPAKKYISLILEGCQPSVNIENNFEIISAKLDSNSTATELTLPCKFSADGAATTQWTITDTDELVGSISSAGVLTPGVNFVGRIRLASTDLHDSSIILKYSNVNISQSSDFSCAVDIASDIESPAMKYVSLKLEGYEGQVKITGSNPETVNVKTCDPISTTANVTLPCKFITTGTPATEWKLSDSGEVVGSISSSRVLTPGTNYMNLIRLASTTDLKDSSIILTSPSESISFSCAVDIASELDSPVMKYITLKLEDNKESILTDCSAVGITMQCGGVILDVIVIVLALCLLKMTDPWKMLIPVIGGTGIVLCVIGLILSLLYLSQDSACVLAYPEAVCRAGIAMGALGIVAGLTITAMLFCQKPPQSTRGDGEVEPSNDVTPGQKTGGPNGRTENTSSITEKSNRGKARENNSTVQSSKM